MSTATAFRSINKFSFCAQNIAASVPSGTAYLSNLSLTEAMAFAWNFETATLATDGSASNGNYTANGVANLCLNPIGSSVFDEGDLSDASMWYGASLATTAFGSWPAIREPRDRICLPSQNIPGTLFWSIGENTAGEGTYEVSFHIGTDPANAGAYRLYYQIDFRYIVGPGSEAGIIFSHLDSIAGYSVATNGGVTIAGHEFAWYCHVKDGNTSSGTLELTATSGNYTY